MGLKILRAKLIPILIQIQMNKTQMMMRVRIIKYLQMMRRLMMILKMMRSLNNLIMKNNWSIENKSIYTNNKECGTKIR